MTEKSFHHNLQEYYEQEENKLKCSHDEIVAICEALLISFSLRTYLDKMNLLTFNSFKHLYSKQAELITFTALIESLNKNNSHIISAVDEIENFNRKRIDLTEETTEILAITRQIRVKRLKIDLVHKVKPKFFNDKI